MKTKYLVLSTFDPKEFCNLDDALRYAEMLSRHEIYKDELIRVIKIEETEINGFLNGVKIAYETNL